MADPFVSRRQVLANLIVVEEQKLKYIQDQITAAERQKRHQAHALRGGYIRSPFVVLHVMQKLGAGHAMIEFVSKLILPSRVVSPIQRDARFNWPDRFRFLMNRRRVIIKADRVWDNRFAVEHRRVIRKAKRLMAEFRVYQDIFASNGRGVAPKRIIMVQALRRHWLFNDVDTDDLPARLDNPKKARRWSVRFRRFWKVRWGKMSLKSCLSFEEQGAKVCRSGTKFGTKIGPKNETTFWS